MTFIAVLHGKSLTTEGLDRYNFGRTTRLFETKDFKGDLLTVLETPDTLSAVSQSNRYSSGLFGSRVAENIDDLRQTLAEWQ
jgi:hypothetical protein